MNYIGLKCGICGEEFKDGDDVVVCPDCGTPMHRACYKENNCCPNEDKHAEGFVFDGFDAIKRSAQGKSEKPEKITLQKKSEEATSGRSCPVCGASNRPGASFCDSCGTRLSASRRAAAEEPDSLDLSDPKNFAAFTIGQGSDVPASAEYEENITAGDVACFVAVNTPYYLSAFKRIKDGFGKFNFSAAVFSGVWYLYRKLYKVGALLLSIQTLLYALRVYFTHGASLDVMNKLLSSLGLSMSNATSLSMEQYVRLSEEMQKLPMNEQLLMAAPTIVLILQITVMIVSGALANKIYYRRCIDRIKQVKRECAEESLSRSETSQSLYLSGGVNAMLAGVFGFVYLFLLFM